MTQSLSLKNHYVAISLILPLGIIIGYLSHTPSIFYTINIGLAALILLGDLWGPRMKSRIPFSTLQKQNNDADKTFSSFNIYLYLYASFYIVSVLLGLYLIASSTHPVAWFFTFLNVGIVGGFVLIITHEMMHMTFGAGKYFSFKFEKYLARLAGVFTFWGIHEIEHNYSHHLESITVTDQDPSASKLGQSFYSFLKTIFFHNLKDGWRIQKNILKNQGKSIFHFQNIYVITLILSTLLTFLIYLLTGFPGVLFFLLQAFISVATYTLFTYFQHYGLERKKFPNGQYEPHTYFHTWTSDTWVTNILGLNGPLHAHHHLYPFCPYYKLKIIEGSPILPYGYGISCILALMPSVWFKIMDKEVAKVRSTA